MAEQKKHHHRRGCWYTGFLIVIMLRNFVFSIMGITLYTQEVERALPWLLPSMIILSMADIVAAVGIWNWKNWGLTLYVVSTLAAIAVGLLVSVNPFGVFYQLIPLVILGAFLTKRRQFFE